MKANYSEELKLRFQGVMPLTNHADLIFPCSAKTPSNLPIEFSFGDLSKDETSLTMQASFF